MLPHPPRAKEDIIVTSVTAPVAASASSEAGRRREPRSPSRRRPDHSQSRIGYVFVSGYTVLLLAFGILPTLWIIVGLIVMSGLASGAAKPIAGSHVGAGHAHR